MAVFIGTVCLWCLYLFDLYDLDLATSGHEVFMRCLRALGCGILLIAPVWWLLAPRDAQYQKLEVSIIAFIIGFCIYRLIVERFRRNYLRGQRVLLVGSDPIIQLLAGAMQQRISLPLKLTGIVGSSKDSGGIALSFATCGDLKDLDSLCESFHPNRLAVGMQMDGESLPSIKLLQLRRQGVSVEDATELYEAICGRVPVHQIDMRSMAFGRSLQPDPFTAQFYRFFGMLFAVTLALLLSPLLLCIAIAIKLDSKGPIFYRQERVGLNGKLFQAIKFRSMCTDAETSTGPVWASENDPRVTSVGRILRKLRLDEFAQIWNVLRGEMCLVGPRPERPHFTNILCQHIPYYDVRHSVPPGITGWAQVCASYGSSVEESRVKLEYDLFYLKNQSVLLDALIIFKTIKIAFFGRGAR
jgi:exopolysaccharide biosynthesis polyprenyl glycosylphosphotransferase